MIWLLLPLVVLCMGYMTSYVWRLDLVGRARGIEGPGIYDKPPDPPPAPPPPCPDDRAPVDLGADDLELQALLVLWRHEFVEGSVV